MAVFLPGGKNLMAYLLPGGKNLTDSISHVTPGTPGSKSRSKNCLSSWHVSALLVDPEDTCRQGVFLSTSVYHHPTCFFAY